MTWQSRDSHHLLSSIVCCNWIHLVLPVNLQDYLYEFRNTCRAELGAMQNQLQ